MCTYKSLVSKKLEIIFISEYQTHALLLQMLSKTFWTHFLILLYNVTTSLLKIDEPLSTFQFAIHGLKHSETDTIS